MMMGSADGSGVPCSLSLISFMAMENSNLSIFPSLFMSARVLTERWGTDDDSNHWSDMDSFRGKPLQVCMCAVV